MIARYRMRAVSVGGRGGILEIQDARQPTRPLFLRREILRCGNMGHFPITGAPRWVTPWPRARFAP